MSTPAERRAIRRKPLDALPEREPMTGFDVIVEQVIGHVNLGEGDEHPFDVAMRIIARQQGQTSYPDATYSFPGEAEGLTVRVRIEHVHDRLTP